MLDKKPSLLSALSARSHKGIQEPVLTIQSVLSLFVFLHFTRGDLVLFFFNDLTLDPQANRAKYDSFEGLEQRGLNKAIKTHELEKGLV